MYTYISYISYIYPKKYPEEKFLCKSLLRRLTSVSLFGWPFDLFLKKKIIIILPTFFSASAFFFPSVPPSFHFHSLSLVSGSNWEEGHSSIISLGTYRHISHCSRQHKKWALYLIPRNDCWHQRPADKYWNFWKNVVLLKMLTTCQAECLLTYMWRWGNTDFTSPDCHSGKVKKVA